MTLGGKLNIRRKQLYSRQEKVSVYAADEYLKINDLPFKATKMMMAEMAFYGQNEASFESAVEMMKRGRNVLTNTETLRAVTEYVGEKVFANDTKAANEIYENMHKLPIVPEKDKEEGVLYILTDGAALNTRIEDDNGSTWRENKLVMAFTDKDMIKRANGDHIITKKEYAAYIGSVEEFRKYMLYVAVRAGYGKIKEVVIIADGATWIRNVCDDIFPDAIQILDKFHLEENMFKYAKYKFGEDEAAYTKWAKSIMKHIEDGKKEKAISILEKEDYSNLPKTVPNILGYVNNNINKIDYPAYKKAGYFVGSGAIESGNKVVLQRRCKQAGMRWSVPGAQSVLTLRSKAASNLWHEVTDLIAA